MTDPPVESVRVGRGAALWSVAAAVCMAISVAGSYWIAPEDVEGPIQRLVFLHVPIAVVSLIAFGVACVAGLMYLRTRSQRWDDIVVVSCGLGLLFTVLAMITGSIWAKAFWGTWWSWQDARLVTYLIIGLIYAAFFVLRSSSDSGAQARFSAVFAVVAFASIPLSFWAVRTAESAIHPVALDRDGLNMDGPTGMWFVIGHVAMTVVFIALLKVELLQRQMQRRLSSIRLALEESAQ